MSYHEVGFAISHSAACYWSTKPPSPVNDHVVVREPCQRRVDRSLTGRASFKSLRKDMSHWILPPGLTGMKVVPEQ